MFWGQWFLCDKNFGVSSCLYLYESLAADAPDAVRSRENVSTLQLAENEDRMMVRIPLKTSTLM